VIDIFALSYQRPEFLDALKVETYGEYNVKVPSSDLKGEEKSSLDMCVLDDGYTKGKHQTAINALYHVFQSNSLENKKIGLDEMGVPPEIWAIIKSDSSAGEINPAYDSISYVKMDKTEEEINRIKNATRIIEEAYLDTIERIIEGVTEVQIADALNDGVRAREGRPALWLVGVGYKGALTDRLPTHHRLRVGDLIMFDMGCWFKGYYSDTARTAVLGEPSGKQREYYTACLAAEQAALAEIKPGVQVSKLFKAAVEAARKLGISDYKRHHVGHGLGIYPYDPPSIRADNLTKLEEGMVINIETPYYEMGFGGIQIEDTVVVNSAGFDYITSLNRDLLII
jgi:Xaa-Pro aminopeptidase